MNWPLILVSAAYGILVLAMALDMIWHGRR